MTSEKGLILLPNKIEVSGIPVFNCRDMLGRPHDYGEALADNRHINEWGNQVYARKFYEYQAENDFFRQISRQYILCNSK